MAHVRDREGCLRTLSQLSAACRFAVPSPAAAPCLCPLWRLPRSGRVDAAYLGGGAAGQRETDSGPVGVLHRRLSGHIVGRDASMAKASGAAVFQ